MNVNKKTMYELTYMVSNSYVLIVHLYSITNMRRNLDNPKTKDT